MGAEAGLLKTWPQGCRKGALSFALDFSLVLSGLFQRSSLPEGVSSRVLGHCFRCQSSRWCWARGGSEGATTKLFRSWSDVDCAKEESQEDAGDGNRDDGAGALSAASEELPLRR